MPTIYTIKNIRSLIVIAHGNMTLKEYMKCYCLTALGSKLLNKMPTIYTLSKVYKICHCIYMIAHGILSYHLGN